MIQFVKEAYSEIKKVEWPSKAETMRLTTYVIGVSLAVGVFTMGLDYVFKEFVSYIITK